MTRGARGVGYETVPAWVPIWWRVGWLWRAVRCREPRCMRTLSHSGRCPRHVNAAIARGEQP